MNYINKQLTASAFVTLLLASGNIVHAMNDEEKQNSLLLTAKVQLLDKTDNETKAELPTSTTTTTTTPLVTPEEQPEEDVIQEVIDRGNIVEVLLSTYIMAVAEAGQEPTASALSLLTTEQLKFFANIKEIGQPEQRLLLNTFVNLGAKAEMKTTKLVNLRLLQG